MDLSDEEKSVRLYETLEQIGVCERMRQVCRQWIIQGITESIKYKLSNKDGLILNFGSSIEGFSIRALAPDVDIVMSYNGCVINDASNGKHKKISHHIVASTFPGYVKLQMLSFGKTPDKTFCKNSGTHVPDKSGRLCLKGVYDLEDLDSGRDLEETFKEQYKHIYKREEDYSKHGPANRFKYIDVVLAFKSYDILNIIQQWVSRKRLYDWPSDHLRKRCSEYPTLIVKTGHPFSEEKDIEWRISFSLSERELMFSLNPTQHKCYATLKMIKHDLLNQALSEEFITSYHLKTCVFWAVQNTPEEMWRPEQLLRCVSICLWYLLYFVLMKNCPNYFLPTANLFQRPAFLDVQRSLLNVIKHSVTGLVDVICRIKCADVGHLFQGSFSTRIIEITEPCILGEIGNMCLSLLQNLQAEIFLMKSVELACGSMETRITRWKHMLEEIKCFQISPIISGFDHSATKAATDIISMQVNLRLALSFAAKAIATQDESVRVQLIKSTMDCSSDLFTARLTYLTLLFKLNRLSECVEVLKDLVQRLSKSKRSYCYCKPTDTSYIVKDFMEQDITTLFRTQITCMIFMPEENGVVPEPFVYEMNLPIDDRDSQVNELNNLIGCNRNWVSVDGLVYFLFMGYLVCSSIKSVTTKDFFYGEFV